MGYYSCKLGIGKLVSVAGIFSVMDYVNGTSEMAHQWYTLTEL